MNGPTTGTASLRLSGDLELLARHPLYAALDGEEPLRCFLRAHVFAVWDFQTLLKALQRVLTCVEVPWFPTPDRKARRLINEIVLEEESDVGADGTHLSHFEMYLEAMQAAAADTRPVNAFLAELAQGRDVELALAGVDLPAGVREFVSGTFAVVRTGEPHLLAAAFAYGREEAVPVMFRQVVERLAERHPDRWEPLRYYLERHIDVDAERHGPQSRAIVDRLCGQDEKRWAEAKEAARASLRARVRFWDRILATLKGRNA